VGAERKASGRGSQFGSSSLDREGAKRATVTSKLEARLRKEAEALELQRLTEEEERKQDEEEKALRLAQEDGKEYQGCR
jgi:hypothetical protein